MLSVFLKTYRINFIVTGILAIMLAGCGDGVGTPKTELTLDSCTTSVAADVPDFYSKYFKCSTITKNGLNIIIRSNGQPPHLTAYYGLWHVNYTSFDTSGGNNQNPNKISIQNITLQFPINPVAKAGLTINGTLVNGTQGDNANEYKMGVAGISLDSVALYNALAQDPDKIADEVDSFDSYNAHADANGAYHYHTNSKGPLEVMVKLGLNLSSATENGEYELYGIMCDGTVVMGCSELDKTNVNTGAYPLDSQNGHVHDLVDDKGATLLTSRYHVHVCPGTPGTFPHKYNPEIQYYNACSST